MGVPNADRIRRVLDLARARLIRRKAKAGIHEWDDILYVEAANLEDRLYTMWDAAASHSSRQAIHESTQLARQDLDMEGADEKELLAGVQRRLK